MIWRVTILIIWPCVNQFILPICLYYVVPKLARAPSPYGRNHNDDQERPQAELEAAAGWGLVGHAAILAGASGRVFLPSGAQILGHTARRPIASRGDPGGELGKALDRRQRRFDLVRDEREEGVFLLVSLLDGLLPGDIGHN